jgi:hypothetical protein
MANHLSILPNYRAWTRLIRDPSSRQESGIPNLRGSFYGGKGTRPSIENTICDSNAFRKEYLGIELEIR